MSEFMGLIRGAYDGKATGFVPGGASLHNRMTPHGPDAAVYKKATTDELKPMFLDTGLAFMFETCYYLELSDFARNGSHREVTYANCWQDFNRANL